MLGDDLVFCLDSPFDFNSVQSIRSRFLNEVQRLVVGIVAQGLSHRILAHFATRAVSVAFCTVNDLTRVYFVAVPAHILANLYVVDVLQALHLTSTQCKEHSRAFWLTPRTRRWSRRPKHLASHSRALRYPCSAY